MVPNLSALRALFLVHVIQSTSCRLFVVATVIGYVQTKLWNATSFLMWKPFRIFAPSGAPPYDPPYVLNVPNVK